MKFNDQRAALLWFIRNRRGTLHELGLGASWRDYICNQLSGASLFASAAGVITPGEYCALDQWIDRLREKYSYEPVSGRGKDE